MPLIYFQQRDISERFVRMFGVQFPPAFDSQYDVQAVGVKHLQDLCLRCIGDHLNTIPVVSRYGR